MFLRYHAKAFWFSAALAALLSGRAEAGAEQALASHRAIYDLTLKHASDTSGIDDMYGRMVYEFTGSECTGYNVRFRFVTEVDMGGERRLTDQQTSTFEDLKDKLFRFETKSYSNDKLSQDVRGEAQENAEGLQVDLTGKDPRKLSLAKSIFPTEQMIDVIDRARKGEKFFETRVFDGSDDADKSMFTTTVVGAKVTPSGPDTAVPVAMLASAPYWPVTMTYFDDKTGSDQLPTYSVSFKLYENGITRDLTMDYGDFVLVGKLAKLELLRQDPKCPS